MIIEQELIDNPERITAQYKDKFTALNAALILDRNLDWETVDKLVKTHELRLMIFDEMENTDDVSELKKLAKQFKMLEFVQQTLWGFPIDSRYHMWFTVPKCQCPYHDNMENRGTDYQIVNMSCPVHGKD